MVIANLGEFRSGTGFFSTPSILESASRLHPAVWWMGVCSTQPLSKLASDLLSMPPTAAQVEREWSGHGFVHNKNRNRLQNTRVTKLVTVRSTLKAATLGSTATPAQCLSIPQLDEYFDKYLSGESANPGDATEDEQDGLDSEDDASAESDGSEWADSPDEADDVDEDVPAQEPERPNEGRVESPVRVARSARARQTPDAPHEEAPRRTTRRSR